MEVLRGWMEDFGSEGLEEGGMNGRGERARAGGLEDRGRWSEIPFTTC